MPTSSRIYGPSSVELGKTGTGRISVVCWNTAGTTPLKYGIGYKVPGVDKGKSSWHGWKDYSESVPCDQSFEFTFEVTQDMWDKQKAGNSLFIYSCDGMADRPIIGVGKGRYSYFAVTKPGVIPIGGRVWVVTGTSRESYKKILTIYADTYKDGRIYKKSQKWGGARASPDYKVFREDLPSIWGQLTYLRESYFDTLAQDEKDWLIAEEKVVVPADWTPASGVPMPTYELAGTFTSFPSAIPIEAVPGWGVKLTAGTLPVTFDLQGISCTDVLGEDVTPPIIAGQIPVMFSVNGVTIAALTPASKVTLDLAPLFSLWATTLTMGTKEISLTAQTVPTTIEGVSVPGIMASGTIAVTEKAPDPCAGIVCDPVCIGLDLWSQKCEAGVCVPDAFIEANSEQCGYVPPPPTPCTSTLLGDVNGDGVVDQADADLLFNWASFPNLRDTTYKLTCPENADVNGDGVIDGSDATLLYNHVAFPDDPAYALGPTDTTPPAPPPLVCTSTLLGDVNGDGVVDQADADLLFNWASFSDQRETTYKLTCPENADVNGDGVIDGSDATLLYNHVAFPDDPAYALGPTDTTPPAPPPSGCPIPTVEVYESTISHTTPTYPGDSVGSWAVRARSLTGEGSNITSSMMELHGPDGYVFKPLQGPVGEGWFGLPLWSYGLWTLKIKVDNNCGETSGWVEFSEEFVKPVTPPTPPECALTDADYFTCPDGTRIQLNECVNGVKMPIIPIPTCPPPECALTDADYFTCPDGTRIQLNECVNGVKMPIIPIPTCPPLAPPQLCTEGETRSPITCWDGSQINAEICTKDEFGGTAWLPSGEACPMRAITRVMDMAIPAIMYEGQVVDIVVQVFCGAAASTNEPTTLQVDGMAVQTKNTLAGNVTFRWTAKGVGMHKVCAVIPINPNCAVPGTTCKTITVSAHVEGIMEQIKAEKTTYESQLEYLRGLKKQLKARPTYGAIPGSVFVPPSFAGRIIDVGGIIRTVPPGGISVPVPPGSNIVTIIGDAGERINVPVTVNPGLTVTLPTIPGLPGLPGGF